MTDTPFRIAISAGEASGNEHALGVVLALRERFPNAEFRGMGDRHLREAGVETIVDSEVSGSILGFTEVLASFGRVYQSFQSMKNFLKNWKPNILIVVDYQDFHFRLMKAAHALGIPVLFFISPSVWAWRSGRVRLVNEYAHTMAAIYPFEPEFYRSHGCKKVVYVGHPFVEEYERHGITEELRASRRRELGISENEKLIVLAPGSRKKEIQTLLPYFHEALRKLRLRHPDWRYVIPVAPSIPLESFSAILEEIPELQLSSIGALELYQAGDLGLIKSGTSNLQAAFAGLPFVMLYKMNAFTVYLVRSLVNTKDFSIVNIIRPSTVPEIIQEELHAQALVKRLEQLAADEGAQRAQKLAFREVVAGLEGFDTRPEFQGTKSVAERVAVLARGILEGKRMN